MARAAAVVGLALTALLSGGPTAVAQGGAKPKVVVNGGTVFHSEAIAPNTIKTFTVTCPPGHVPVTGGVAVPGKGVTLMKSVPGARSWTFTIGSPVTNGPDVITVQVRCLKPLVLGLGKGGKVKLKLKAKAGKAVVVPPGAVEDTKLKCPDGSVPLSGSQEQQGTATPKSAPPGSRAAQAIPRLGEAARLVAARPVRGGFELTTRNPSASRTAVVRHHALCGSRVAITRSRAGERGTARFEVTRRTSPASAQPGFPVLTERCPAGRIALSAGWSYPVSADVLVLATTTARDGRMVWLLQNGSHQAQPFERSVLCSPGRVTFDRGRPSR